VDGAVLVATALCCLAADESAAAPAALREAAVRLPQGSIRNAVVALLDAAGAGEDPLGLARRRGTGIDALAAALAGR
jgi:hypothetical protein